jgi:hypothetical protein
MQEQRWGKETGAGAGRGEVRVAECKIPWDVLRDRGVTCRLPPTLVPGSAVAAQRLVSVRTIGEDTAPRIWMPATTLSAKLSSLFAGRPLGADPEGTPGALPVAVSCFLGKLRQELPTEKDRASPA